MSLYDTGIRPAIDAYLKKKSEEERNYGDYWSASSAGYCMRLNIMRRLGVPKVPELQDKDAQQTRVFEAGHIFHEWLQRITKDAGLSIAQEVELQDEDLMIRGHFDDLVLVKKMITVSRSDVPMTADNPSMLTEQEFDHLILYDYKTAHSASFNYKKNQDIGHYHKMQLGTYMYMLRQEHWQEVLDTTSDKIPFDIKTELKEARILSISKDDLRLDEKQLLWSPQLEKEVYQYWSTLNGYWKARKLPACTCDKFDGGFMGKRSSKGKIYNDYFYNDTPCSQEWLELTKKEGKWGNVSK